MFPQPEAHALEPTQRSDEPVSRTTSNVWLGVPMDTEPE